jgi:hypothetical protein
VDDVRGTEYPADGAAESVWTPEEVAVTTKKSIPLPDVVARVCEDTEEPFNDAIDPPAPPASVPQ